MTVREPESTGIELQFEVTDQTLFFISASEQTSCTVTLVEMIQRSDGTLLEYFTITQTPPERIHNLVDVTAGVETARTIREDGDEILCEFVVSGPCIGGTLADTGALIREAYAVNGVGHVVADVPPYADTTEVIDHVRSAYDVELVARRERDRPMPEFTRREFRARLAELLTDRQLETLRTAYASGYFGWPRESTAEECADALDITQPTFTQHIRAAQRKLFTALFAELDSEETERSLLTIGPTDTSL